jgi:hypothetical protein
MIQRSYLESDPIQTQILNVQRETNRGIQQIVSNTQSVFGSLLAWVNRNFRLGGSGE